MGKNNANEKAKNGKSVFDIFLTPAIYIVFGVIMTFFPTSTIKTICYFLAGIMIVVGGIKLVVYFRRESMDGFIKTGLISGIVYILLGILLAARARFIISIIPFVLGIMICVSGISKLQNGLELKKMGGERGKTLVLLGIINVIIGLVIMINPFKTATIILVLTGIFMLYSGITDLIIDIYVIMKIKNKAKEMQALDQEYREK